MPISYGQFEKQLRLLPLTLNADGSATVSWRFGFIDDGNFVPSEEYSARVTAEDVSRILDAPAREGMTRRDDLSLAVYTYLVASGLVKAGEVS